MPVLSTSGGTSDARFVKDHCPVVEFGLVGQSMHQVDEFAEIEHIEKLKRVYSRRFAGLLRRMLTIGLTDDIVTCHALRRVVFIEEQNVDETLEVDGRDGDALHLLARLDGVPVGCARVLIAGDTAKIGRVCVLRAASLARASGRRFMPCHGRGAARTVRLCARRNLGRNCTRLGSMPGLGLLRLGQSNLDAGIMHRDMVLDLSA